MLLVLVGGVMSANAKIIYIQNTNGYSKLCVHMWGSNVSGEPTDWPGAVLRNGDTDNVETITINAETAANQKYYKVDLGSNAYFIVNDGSSYNKTGDLAVSDYTGTYYYMGGSGEGGVTLTSLTVYDYTINVASASQGTDYYVYYWNGNGNNGFPGKKAENGIYTFKAYTSSVGIIITQGNDTPKTCDMTAAAGTNNFYICGMDNSDGAWGEAVKTNGSGYATYVSTKNLTIPANTAYCAEDNNNGTATAHSVTKPAGTTAMLIKGNPNTTYHFGTRSSSDNETLAFTNAFKAGDDSNVASYESATGSYNYILNGNTFFAAAGKKVAKGKAYLQLTAQASSSSPALIFADGETTGIHLISAVDETDNNYYSLQGERIANPTKGIYIKNGKKVIIK